ncbi:hypothetical protein DPMN_007421 [Dreissena polymorpha]|uniref:Uncharacterized protein n=1 Tax=Dreissena polymorpha TaxID=45954 RepID=A0A9D4MXC3_DREPO|nr:hypothetical protein DPMN_007421 [Dreissena polymorpha]
MLSAIECDGAGEGALSIVVFVLDVETEGCSSGGTGCRGAIVRKGSCTRTAFASTMVRVLVSMEKRPLRTPEHGKNAVNFIYSEYMYLIVHYSLQTRIYKRPFKSTS